MDQRPYAEDVHGSRQVVGEHAQRHLGADVLQPLHQEVGGAHPGLDGPEGMLDRLAPLTHGPRVLIEPPLDGFKDIFVLPARDAALLARRALVLHGAASADVGPIAAQGQSPFFARAAIAQARAGRADIDVLFGEVAEVLLAEAALGLSPRGQRLGQGELGVGIAGFGQRSPFLQRCRIVASVCSVEALLVVLPICWQGERERGGELNFC